MPNFAQMFGLRAMRVNQGGSKRRRRRRPVEESGDSGEMSMKDMLTLQRQASKDEFDKEKEFVGKFTELFFKARESGDETLQRHLKNYAYDYIGQLSPQSKALMEPMLRGGPFSPMKQKMDMWEKHNPMPQITVDPEISPHAYAQQVVDQERWRAAQTHFATGTTPKMRSIIPTMIGGEKKYITQDKDGAASLLDDVDLNVQDFAKKFGVSPAEVYQTGGARGKDIKSVENGVARTHTPFTSIITGKTNLELVSGRSEEQMHKQDKEMHNLLATIASGNEDLWKKDPIAQRVIELSKGEEGFEKTAAPYLEQLYPGRVFFKPKQEASWWDQVVDVFTSGDYVKYDGKKAGGFVEGDAGTIAWRPGVRQTYKASTGKLTDLIHDEENNMVYEATNGAALGNPEQALKSIEAAAVEDARRAAKRKEDEERKKNRRDEIDIYSSGSY